METADKHKDCCRPPSGVSANCPACGKPGRKVAGVTLDQHLSPARRARLGDAAGFCPNPDCVVVYFSGAATVNKGETLLPVTQKETGDDVYVCYCFGIKRSDIRRDLAAFGTTGIQDRVRREVAVGRCECERKNPQGACCLGNIATEIRKIKEEISHEK